MAETIVQNMPEELRDFLDHACSLSLSSFELLPPEEMPQPQRELLTHSVDMTSTLADFHESALQVDLLQKKALKDVYIREVYLRTIYSEEIVEYGVIAIVLGSFEPEQRKVIEEAKEPLGGLLHQFKIEFKSAPICFFSLAEGAVTQNPVAGFGNEKYYGRFNRLSKPNDQTLAWIMEILPGNYSDT
ncbi:MAG: hypothetical protein O7C75_09980 [Verrucomicrobia bacterium]|nr:hypothetical protein [Verrucomicrobiota bacterium]